MRVVQLGPFPPPHGGVQTHVVALRDFLRRRGDECDVINITANRKPDADGVYYPRSAMGLVMHLVGRKYDVIHLHVGGDLSNRVALLALVCGTVPWATSVFTFHSGGYPSSPAGRRARPRSLAGLALRRFDAVIGVNPELLEVFARLGVHRDRAHLIEPHSFLTPLTGVQAPLPPRLEAFFSSHSRTLISVGLLEPEYDLPLQISVLERLREEDHNNVGLVIIGSGSLHAELDARVTASPAREHLLLAGDVPHSATLASIARSDVLLRTTRFDGDAISVREALHVGTPVVATNTGMRPHGVRLVEAGSESALLSVVRSLLAEPRRRDQPRNPSDHDENLARVVALYA